MTKAKQFTESGTSPPTVRLVALTQGYFALVDAEDYARVNQFKWFADVARHPDGTVRTVYAKRNVRKADGTWTMQKMHCFIMEAAGIEHRDHNGLNNCRHNLRPATKVQNGRSMKLRTANSSGYKGVTWHKQNKRWCAQIMVKGKHISLGCYTDPVVAARAYDAAALKYFGEFAMTNVMLGLLSPLKKLAQSAPNVTHADRHASTKQGGTR